MNEDQEVRIQETEFRMRINREGAFQHLIFGPGAYQIPPSVYPCLSFSLIPDF